MDIHEGLRHVPIFEPLADEQLETLAGCAREKNVRSGRKIRVFDRQALKSLASGGPAG